MSAMQHDDLDDLDEREAEGLGEPVGADPSVVVRRRAGVSALVGVAASAVSIAYLWRAADSGSATDWLLCVLLGLLAVAYFATLLDARTPLLVADELGVRIRLGRQWRGLPWAAVTRVEVAPRRGALRDGTLIFRPHSLDRALEGLDTGGRRAARLNQGLYGAALAVPLGLTTRGGSRGSELVADLSMLAAGRAEVALRLPATSSEARNSPEVEPTMSGAVPPDHVTRTPQTTPAPLSDPVSQSVSDPAYGPLDVEPEHDDVPAQKEEEGEPRRSFGGAVATALSRAGRGRRRDTDLAGPVRPEVLELDVDAVAQPEPEPPRGAERPVSARSPREVAFRAARPAARAHVTRDEPATTVGAAALRTEPLDRSAEQRLPEHRELRRPGAVDLVVEPSAGSAAVRPLARLGEAVAPLVIDDFVTEPAFDPVIGPELAAARTRTGLSVDGLADRTRIRPHVIEAIEVDDFGPCGGDFYARGHLRTLARFLGQDVEPLLANFDRRYATAPINARRVFEAELSTGLGRGSRAPGNGGRWGLLVGAVLVLVLVWGLVRLFETDPVQLVPAPPLTGQSADQPANQAAGVSGASDQVGTSSQSGTGSASSGSAPATMPVRLVANVAATKVTVRDGNGKVVYAGPLVLGERRALVVAPPLRVRALDAGALTVFVAGQDRGPVGVLGEPGTRVYRRPAAG